MKGLYYLLIACSALFTTACSSNSPKQANSEAKVEENEIVEIPDAFKNECQYTYIKDSTQILWTAYKYESKAGVGGSFGAFDVFPLVETGTFTEVLNGVEFRIQTNSSNSANADRDKKIQKHFWDNIEKSDLLIGEIKEVSGNQEKGSVKIEITINGITAMLEGIYVVDEGLLTLNTEINLEDFGALEAIAALNNVCEDLHREAPGQKSVLWPNVSVKVEAYLQKECSE